MTKNVYFLAGNLRTTLETRIKPLASELEHYGVSSEIIMSNESRVLNIAPINTLTTYPLKKFLKIISSRPDAIVINKLSSLNIRLIQKFCSNNKDVKVIFDINDPIFLRTIKLFGLTVRSPMFSHLESVIRDADFVTTNGKYLLDYVKTLNSSSMEIPDPINTELFTPQEKNSDLLTIGWEGNPFAHYDNLVFLRKPLMELSKEYNLRFKIVSYLGDLKIKEAFRDLEKVMEVDYGLDHWVSLKEFSNELSEFDILLAPLSSTSWYEGKSNLRVGLGMSKGIPVVASPVGEQKYVLRHGINGFLAKTEEEWFYYLKLLIEDNELRNKMGRNGRRTAIKKFSSKVCSKKLYEILNNINKTMR